MRLARFLAASGVIAPSHVVPETRKLQYVAGDVITEVQVTDITDYPELSVMMGREISRFCYVRGHRDLGRALPPCKDRHGTWGYTFPEWEHLP